MAEIGLGLGHHPLRMYLIWDSIYPSLSVGMSQTMILKILRFTRLVGRMTMYKSERERKGAKWEERDKQTVW